VSEAVAQLADVLESGVVLERGDRAASVDVSESAEFVVDVAASDELRSRLRAARAEQIARLGDPFFDRGPGYARLSGGRTFADVDLR
jgi:N-methylhydantoinase B